MKNKQKYRIDSEGGGGDTETEMKTNHWIQEAVAAKDAPICWS